MTSGMVLGYVAVAKYGANPVLLAWCFGAVGFMLYGPDTLMGGAAAVQVAGERNAVAVAGLVNGLGSLGPVVQEELIGRIMGKGNTQAGINHANLLCLGMSVAVVVLYVVIAWNVSRSRRALGKAGT